MVARNVTLPRDAIFFYDTNTVLTLSLKFELSRYTQVVSVGIFVQLVMEIN